MTQCEAEGRKHPGMDLYAGIFNNKLYASSRGASRGSSTDNWSRNAFNSDSAKTENMREGGALSDGNTVEARSASPSKNKTSELSAGSESTRRLTSYSRESHAPYHIPSLSVDVGNGSTVNRSLVASDLSTIKAGGVQGDGNRGAYDRHACAGTDNGHLDKSENTPLSYVGNVSSSEAAAKPNAAFPGNGKSRLLAGRGAKTDGKPEVMNSVNVKDRAYQQKADYVKVKGLQAPSNSSSERTNNGRQGNKFEGPKANLRKVDVSLQEKCISADQQKTVSTANQQHYLGGNTRENMLMKGVSDIQVGGDLQGNGHTRKNQEYHIETTSSALRGVRLKEQDKPGDRSAAANSSSSSGLERFERKSVPMTPIISASDVRAISHDLSHAGNLMHSVIVKNQFVNSVPPQEHEVHALQSGSKDLTDLKHIQDGRAIVAVSNRNGYIKTGAEAALESTSHNLVSTLRVKSSPSTDSSSSQGGSSHSGSPTAVENCRDKAPSSRNILFGKGSPHSSSSRSIGSSSFLVNNSIAPIKSSFIDGPASQFRYGMSSGRKSAELVPNMRHSEMVPNRKSSEMTSNKHIREPVRLDVEANSFAGSANFSKGTGSTSSNTSVGNGNLVVGSGNGGVKSVGGTMKPISRQADAVNRANLVECTLLRKAQASADPEEVKNAGNEYYRRGQFSEALMLYTRAVSLSPSNASYRSNRAAAFSATGQLGKAVKDLEDAIGLESSFSRAHQQVASLYVRLGLLERAKVHLIATGQQADVFEAQRLHTIDEHISRCIEARKHCVWHSVIKESDAAVVAGADSAPQIFGYKSEALLELQRPEEADGVCTAAQRVESSLVRSGVIPADPFLLIVRAQVDMALGRFDGALEAATSAVKIDPCNDNVSSILRKAQCVCHSRTTGNELFKAGRFFEALAVYAEGLESDPSNAILLCNRAACRSKLGQWEKAVEDCDAALKIQPNYMKALMRRANCRKKLERWEDALQDYELLRRKMPEDRDVARGLFDVQVAMKKLQGEDTHKMKFGGDVEEVVSDEQFQESITSPGLSVVQFVTKLSERCRQLAPFVDELCKRNPSVNFLRVDVQEHPELTRLECVSFIPTFKIYRSGQKVKEILGPTEQSLEYAVKHYSL